MPPLAKPRGGGGGGHWPLLGVEILGKCVCETLRITFSKKISPAAGYIKKSMSRMYLELARETSTRKLYTDELQ